MQLSSRVRLHFRPQAVMPHQTKEEHALARRNATSAPWQFTRVCVQTALSSDAISPQALAYPRKHLSSLITNSSARRRDLA